MNDKKLKEILARLNEMWFLDHRIDNRGKQQGEKLLVYKDVVKLLKKLRQVDS